MIIVFEGHDRSGKSSISRALSEKLHTTRFKMERVDRFWDPHINLRYVVDGLLQLFEQTKMPIIIDRWIPSDYVYGKLFNRDVNQATLDKYDERMVKLNTLYIHCFKDVSEFIVDEEDKDLHTPADYPRMIEYYNEYFKTRTKCPCLELNTSSQNLEEQLELIMNAIIKYKHEDTRNI